ncbi:thiamine pyrophosphate-dependent enzyme [Pontibacter sp. 13R65]|uniref:alpha-ketoacid dehydrogenase subunit alpha/beta n=1 Tax=Pontibacter sp. 13R65 TaxID=3127458 RepID=UPI00301DAD78
MQRETMEALKIELATLKKAYRLMVTAKTMGETYEEEKAICSKYVHSTSRGHEAIQLATAFQLQPYDFLAPYYRDESLLLGLGLKPYEMMLQLMGKADDPFAGGRTYYGHPSMKREGFPIIPHQSSATGMQAIPATGMAHGLAYLESQGLLKGEQKPVVLCSIGDGAVTEGEVAEAWQMAVLKQLPIIYLVQDNEWGISAQGKEMRAMDAYEYAAGFKGMERLRLDGSDFAESFEGMRVAFEYARQLRRPILVHARCPLLNHHTSGVRREWYRGNSLEKEAARDPLPKLKQLLLDADVPETEIKELEQQAIDLVRQDFARALDAATPDPGTYDQHIFAPTPVTAEAGNRKPAKAEKVTMVDAALHAVDDILRTYPETIFYGQDVGGELGGVFREAALLAKKYGDARVFNTPIQEAYIIGSTAGMSAVGVKAIVEIQFADYIWAGMNQLVVELSKSCYLTNGKFPVQALIRVPIGAYGGGGPYHSGSIESTLLNIRGIKVVYPSNAADMKGLMKAAFLDPNPVVMLEHKGLYWSKVPGTEEARTVEPDEDYVLPLGVARVVQYAQDEQVQAGNSLTVITYGMGIYWAKAAAERFTGCVEILDLRTLNPLDFDSVVASVQRHGKALVLTEEPLLNSFAESLAGRISKACFQQLDAPVFTLGAANLPALPLSIELERMVLPNAQKVAAAMEELLNY